MAVAHRLRALQGDDELPARLGGDEFAVLLPTDERTAVRAIAGALINALAQPFELADGPVIIGGSVGIAIADGSQSPQRLMREADTAMYVAKRSGGSHYRQFDPAMEGAINSRLQQRVEIAEALELEQFTVYYQPVVDLHDGQVSSMEALVRWDHPHRGLIPPGEFIPTVESGSLGVAIDRFVMAQACTQMQIWNRRRPVGRLLRISVNVSAHNLLTDDFLPALRAMLAGTGIDPALLVIEITETLLVVEIERASVVLGEVRDLGVSVAIDDFGIGHSSLRYLQHLPVDVLKIDRSFIQRLGQGPEEEAVAQAITHLGRTLGLQTVAEGVETVEQLDRLRSIGCDLVQGYLLSRPLDVVAAELFLSQEAVRWAPVQQ